MSNQKKEELRALIRLKMKRFCKENRIKVNEFLTIAGITPAKWCRITSGRDVYFSSIHNIVTKTHGYFTYYEFAAILDEPPQTDWITVYKPKMIKRVVEKRVQEELNLKEFGKDTLVWN